MRFWKHVLVLVALETAAISPFFVLAPQANSQTVTTNRQSRDLRQRLESGLRPRTPAEFAFIKRVVKMVEQGKLPRRIVDVTFNWARKKFRRYRFPYFYRALRIEAAKRGIVVR